MKSFFHNYSILANLAKFFTRALGKIDVAIDMGTSKTRIGIFDKGIVLREPTFIGLNTKTHDYIFCGNEAKELFGKSPNFIKIVKPMVGAVISDFDASVGLLNYFVNKAVKIYFNKSLIHPKINCFCACATSSTEVEQKALREALNKVGFSDVFIVEKPQATAYGANIPIFSNNPFFLIDMGAGLIEMAIIVSGGIVAYKSIKNAGDYMDRLIYNYLHLKYGIIIGEQTAENLKINLFNLTGTDKIIPVRGKSLENGLPKSVRVGSGDIREALINSLNQIIDGAKELMETVPPELIDGIIKNGIILVGAQSGVIGIDKYISNELKIPATVFDRAEDATILGLLKLINDTKNLDRILIK